MLSAYIRNVRQGGNTKPELTSAGALVHVEHIASRTSAHKAAQGVGTGELAHLGTLLTLIHIWKTWSITPLNDSISGKHTVKLSHTHTATLVNSHATGSC